MRNNPKFIIVANATTAVSPRITINETFVEMKE
jgi:hypothetical protein